ncbi:MAG TPA: alpha/beta fold hydrolase [Candidatus Microsaccharimonas sp.]|nr:alpha/beta fold hydrolase [Candidatus Microsaccharimonas sp.]
MTPDKFTNQELMLAVGDGHQLYVQDWGSQDAKTPIFFLHGGPGSGCDDGHKQYFDPTTQRVIFHDQRGCGKSLPYGSLESNTTQKLIDDISTIADELHIDKFVIVGGSWGSCLAFAYGLEHPERVSGMVLRGIFTGSQSEIDWLDHGEFQNFFPDAWEAYLATVPKEHRANPSSYHYDRVTGKDPQAAQESGAAYLTLELSAISLDDRHRPISPVDFDPSSIRIEMHYMHNLCFLPDNYILDNAHRLSMPIHLIHGRYDMVCPPVTAYKLHAKFPNSELVWTISGHSAEHETWTAVRSALRQLT